VLTDLLSAVACELLALYAQLVNYEVCCWNGSASPKTPTTTATERDLAMQRWLKKYKYEIP
jgi:hypothetical protein